MFGVKSKPVLVLAGVFIVVMALLPFHAVISTWAISNFGYETLIKAWKELLILFVALPITGWILYKDVKLRNKIFGSRINQLVFLFAALCLLMIPFNNNGTKPEIAGLVFNLRFFVMFIIAQVLALKFVKEDFRELLLRILFWGGVVVVVFGALQVLVLPNDFLRHFGYQKSIIPPYFTIDTNESFVRILSTLRGPNALGAYLVFWLPMLAIVTKRMWSVANKYKVYAAILWALSFITLYGSKSRSAWIGAAIALAAVVWLLVNNQWKKRLVLLGMAGFAVLAVGLAVNWNSSFVQTTIMHRDPNQGNDEDSDVLRQESIVTSIKSIINNPLGTGVGSANLASTYGTKPNTIENYYLQVATELGVVGLLVFMAILVLVAKKLWDLRAHDIAVALLAGFIGIAVVNLVLPGWEDETLAMLWWGMAGLIMFAKSSTKHTKSATV